MSQSKRWCFTLNNYTDEDIDRISQIESTYLIYGKETAASGTPHLQGFVIFPTHHRFNNVKQLIGANAHVEAARGTSKQAAEYCRKEGNFIESGNLPLSQGKRTDWERFRSWVFDLDRIPTPRELVAEFPHLYARYGRKCVEIASLSLPPPELETGDLRDGFQARLADSFNLPPDRRSVSFIVDPEGNSGKSWFCAYCLTKWPDRVQILRSGKREDLAYAIDVSKDIFLFDIGREQMQFLNYSILEMLKDRLVFSSKYESTLKTLRSRPHVVVFCNEEPDRNKLSADRFDVTRIVNI